MMIFGLKNGDLRLFKFNYKGKKEYKLVYEDHKNLELPISAVSFYYIEDKLNLIVGTTLGYLVAYTDINEKNKLKNNFVINNTRLEEAIIDFKLIDLDRDGYLEIFVLYFNKKIHVYKIKNYNKFDYVTGKDLNEMESFPFMFFIIDNDQSRKLLLFSNNIIYVYEIEFNNKEGIKTKTDKLISN